MHHEIELDASIIQDDLTVTVDSVIHLPEELHEHHDEMLRVARNIELQLKEAGFDEGLDDDWSDHVAWIGVDEDHGVVNVEITVGDGIEYES